MGVTYRNVRCEAVASGSAELLGAVLLTGPPSTPFFWGAADMTIFVPEGDFSSLHCVFILVLQEPNLTFSKEGKEHTVLSFWGEEVWLLPRETMFQ